MMKSFKAPFLSFTLLLGAFAGHGFSATLDKESGLIMPTSTSGNVRLIINDEHHIGDLTKRLKVFVGNKQDCCEGHYPLAGRYHVEDNAVVFTPAFNFSENLQYTVSSLENICSDAAILTEFTLKGSLQGLSPQVLKIYPSGPVLPDNTLRFYIHFSTPMKPHMSTQHIKLMNDEGEADTAAFMSFKQELWSEDRRRLTLLMDPGRIKRGVAQNEALGPALEVGKHYKIVVDEGWSSADGVQSIPRFEKKFSVSAALRSLPTIEQWHITAPKKMTLEPLIISFDRPFDHALLPDHVRVTDKENRVIDGTVSVLKNERAWQFVPRQAWQTDTGKIVVNTSLEDVSGNNLRELLDHSVDTVISNVKYQTRVFELIPQIQKSPEQSPITQR